MDLNYLFEFFWKDYTSITPDAPAIHKLLASKGETVVNDHVAFRTYNIDPIRLDSLAKPFLDLGYKPVRDYEFEEKKLHARSFSHPEGPRVFISELKTEEFSPELQKAVRELASKVPAHLSGTEAMFTTLPTWQPVSYDLYQRLLQESEYAGWVSAFGIRVNHFTVSFNHLTGFSSMEEFNAWLIESGFKMNESGGLLKGSPDVLLEQSSTLANRIEWGFQGGEKHVIPSCYYEFARRYTDPSTGKLYDGFVAKSADKIFESTDTNPKKE